MIKLSIKTYTFSVTCMLLLLPNFIVACSTCFGDPDASATIGMNWAIITLLGVTGGVLGGIIKSIISIRNKAQLKNDKV